MLVIFKMRWANNLRRTLPSCSEFTFRRLRRTVSRHLGSTYPSHIRFRVMSRSSNERVTSGGLRDSAKYRDRDYRQDYQRSPWRNTSYVSIHRELARLVYHYVEFQQRFTRFFGTEKPRSRSSLVPSIPLIIFSIINYTTLLDDK